MDNPELTAIVDATAYREDPTYHFCTDLLDGWITDVKGALADNGIPDAVARNVITALVGTLEDRKVEARERMCRIRETSGDLLTRTLDAIGTQRRSAPTVTEQPDSLSVQWYDLCTCTHAALHHEKDEDGVPDICCVELGTVDQPKQCPCRQFTRSGRATAREDRHG